MGKFFILTSALNQGHLALVILAAINTAIAIYYYLSVVRVAYTAEPEARPALAPNNATAAMGVVLVVVIIALGILPGAALETAATAVRALL